MEQPVKRPRGRPRKRRRPEEENEMDTKTKIHVAETKLIALVGRYVLKEFKGNGVYLGKIMYYDSGLYRVDYEDGDCEDLDSSELRYLILREVDFDEELLERRKKLDEFLLTKKNTEKKEIMIEFQKDDIVEGVETSRLTNVSDGGQVEDDADSSSDSCEHAGDRDVGVEQGIPLVPPPQLPPSSGTVGVADEYVSYLFSVYGFLRSFSIRLFLCPFGLDEFVGSLNCPVANTLLDAIHVALLRALRQHLETLSLEGSELASKCLRCIDWSLLDTLTWPVYLVHYFTVMGYIKGPEWEGFYDNVHVKEYYTLPAGRKLMILQILCDDVLESAELRVEIDMRQESEVGADPDAVLTNPLENGPKRVHPRYSKTSACKDREAMEITSESQGMKSSSTLNSLGFSDERAADAAVGEDGNSDECRLCGMDGMLLCCDGCPSAYHSRCIGVVKMHVPDGPWYCPECIIHKMGPTIIMGTSLRGAEILGVDVYGQVFLGTCRHLLVLKASINSEPCLRYYNSNDIPKVLHTLFSSVQHMSLYSGICRAIQQYWDIPESFFCPWDGFERDEKDVCIKGDAKLSTSALCPGKENLKSQDNIEAENASNLNGNSVDTVAVSCLDTSEETEAQTDPGPWSNAWGCHLINAKLPAETKLEFALSTGSISQQAGPSDLSCQSLVDKSSAMCTSVNSNDSCSGHITGICLPANTSSQSKQGNRSDFGRGDRSLADDYAYKGCSFKPYSYMNHYSQGDFAASAAATLASLSSEEILDAQKSGNARKVVSANIAFQAKAFSLVASRFFWPNSQRKLVEVPRERCGWCYTCKATVSSKRGCLLNSAVSTAIKGAMKTIDGLNVKSGEGNIASIAKYILYLEEILCGLVVGPFLIASHRKQWQKRVEEATNCSVLKALLLELEENICNIAVSGEWAKLVDDWLVESSMIQTASSTLGTAQKRGPSGKRQRKQSGVSEVIADGRDNKSFSWWRGGNLSVLVFQKAIVPRSVVRKAARQGGVRKISGIDYADGSEIPKRSRQLVWRAAVERSTNASQLALQVRYLDLYVRWGDLVCPDQSTQDGKGPETEASAFRNAVICNKKIVDNKTRYGVAFGVQKHLSSRVMKNIIEIEQSEDGNDKYWFPETRIPLYLIKEYEQSVNKGVLPSVQKPSSELSDLQRRQLKASRRDIFSYLTCKRDKMEKCCCALCQQDVLLGSAVKCSACEGYCHRDCTLRSMNSITCKHCHHARSNPQVDFITESPTSPLLMHGRECHSAATLTKGSQLKGFNQALTPSRSRERFSEINQATCDPGLSAKARNKICSWGVMWKKRSNDDTGMDFRRTNILLKGNSDAHSLRPVCDLCEQPYDSDLMYIHCETCKKWYHADAVELDESKLPEVVGFKCCKCRRIRGPECPYMDTKLKEQKRKKQRLRAEKQGQGNMRVDFGCRPISGPIECFPTPPKLSVEEVFIPDNDPRLLSLSRVEQIKENNSEVNFDWNTVSSTGLQKLPVRRQGKNEDKVDGSSEYNLSHAEPYTCMEMNDAMNSNEEQSFPCAQWDVSTNGYEGGVSFAEFNFEDMEFEPQTYFSFTELLASDDGGQFDGLDASGDVSGNWENDSSSVPQDGVLEQHGMVPFTDQPVEHMVPAKSTANAMPCRMCSHTEPPPDLCCQICGLLIHSYCCQWDESTSTEGTWTCGHCREWI